jgi:starvation-inducible DNA-binding protein
MAKEKSLMAKVKPPKASTNPLVKHKQSILKLAGKPTSIDLDSKTRQAMIALLNARLADCFDLYSQFKAAHWNVKGMNFIALHELFDNIAEILLAFGDELAERVTALGGYASGTVRLAAVNSSLPEYPPEARNGEAHLNALVEHMALFGSLVRQAIAQSEADADTADLFTEISRSVDKHLWFLEAHLQ